MGKVGLSWSAAALAGVLLLMDVSSSVYAAGSGGRTTLAPKVGAGKSGWKTYRSARAGYAVKYPSSWTVKRHTGANGSLLTTFLLTASRAGIRVTVQSGISSSPTDIGNMHCGTVEVHGLVGTQCLDTISLSEITTFTANGKDYQIATSLKRVGRDTYEKFVRSFRLI